MSAPATCPFCEREHTVQVPYIHSNGTAAVDLMEQYSSALHSVTDTIRRMDSTGPNGRDYYLIPGASHKAAKEHRVRVDQLLSVQAELVEIRDHIQVVIDFEDARKGKP